MKIFKKYFEKNTNFSQFYYEKNSFPQKGSKSQKIFQKNDKILMIFIIKKKFLSKKRQNFNDFYN